MRVGVFGGSFDPIHLGHLAMAEACREAADLNEVWFLPAPHPPHKGNKALARFDHRMEMVELAVAGQELFRPDPMEQGRPGPSFTIDTLRLLKGKHPQHEWFLLIGADSALEFPSWKEPGEILKLATVVVRGRPGANLPVELSGQMEQATGVAPQLVEVNTPPWFDISSSLIRERLAAKCSIRFLVPRAVEEYIRARNLYSQATGS